MVNIGPGHGSLDGKCFQNIKKASERNTDIIFGIKDKYLSTELIEVADPLPFGEGIKQSVMVDK